MPDAVIVDVIRTPGGKRNGSLSGWHPADLAGEVLSTLVERNDLDPALVEMLFDPQTSGPLFIAVPADRAEALRSAIEREMGGCWAIGHAEAGEPMVVVR